MSEHAILRQAHRGDIAAIQRIRAAARENRLLSRRINDDELRRHLEMLGCGWVVEVEQRSPGRPGAVAGRRAGRLRSGRRPTNREVVAFAIGDATIGQVWALFVEPAHQGRGYGRRLLDAMVGWLWS